MSSSPTAAPIRVFISYSHDSEEHADRVLALADRLIEDGVDVALDQYEDPPPADWRLWMENQIEEAKLVLIICTAGYFNKVRQKVKPGEGKGVKWEALLTYQEIYDNDSTNPKFVPVLLEGGKYSDIPKPLRAGNFYDLKDDEGYDKLYRRITGQPGVVKPKRGEIIKRPPRERLQEDRESKPVRKASKPWNVPQERNPVFTGREDMLKQLRIDLLKYGKQALSGLGGIGKTQIAVEYAYRHRDEYAAVLWAFADSEQSVNTGFAAIAKLLDLPEKDSTEQARVINAVKRWMQETENWLLVFDNADAPGIVPSFIPHDPKGHILLTSRAHIFQNLKILKPLEVSVLSPPAALEFLLKRTEREGTAESKEAEVLAEELGYLPLALEQAAAYLLENGSSFKDYLTAYRKQGVKLLEKQGPALGNPKEQQKRTVATAWAVNFADVQKNSPASADVLRLAAFLAPDAIPLELLEKSGHQMGELLAAALAKVENDPLVVDALLKPLSNYSLIRRNTENRSFSIHPLVQELIRDGMTPDMKKSFAEHTVKVLDSAFPEVKFETWRDCDRLITHSFVCVELIKEFDFEFASATRLLNESGYYLKARGQYSEAEPFYRLSLAVRERALGPEHPDTALILNNLAVLYGEQQRYEEAEPLIRRALTIREKILGSDHLATATSMNNLAENYRNQGKYQEAKPLFERALAVIERVQGPEHPMTASALNNLALLSLAQGNYAEAERLLLRALHIDEKALGTDHPDIAIDFHNLGDLYSLQERYSEAESLYRRAVDIGQQALGRQHPASSLYNEKLISCLRAQGKLKEAEELEQTLKGQ